MTKSHIGKSLYFAPAAPATHDDTGFEALSWVKVNGVQQLPQLGVSHADIDVPDLESGNTTRLKGAGTGQQSQMSFRKVKDDTGQGNLRTAAEGHPGIGSVKIIRATGTGGAPDTGDEVQYATGYVKDFVENQGTETTHEGFSVQFQQNGLTVNSTEPA